MSEYFISASERTWKLVQSSKNNLGLSTDLQAGLCATSWSKDMTLYKGFFGPYILPQRMLLPRMSLQHCSPLLEFSIFPRIL